MRATAGTVAGLLVGLLQAVWLGLGTWGDRYLWWGPAVWTYATPLQLASAAALGLAAALLFVRAPALSRTTGLITAGLAGAVFYLVRDPAHLLGDGRLWISVLSGPRTIQAHEPLAFSLSALSTMGLEGQGPAAVAARLEVVSALLGVVGVGLIVLVARTLAREPGGRWGVALLLLSSATLQLGAGYIEAYPWLWATVLAYVLTGVLALRDGRWVAAAGLVAATAVALHGASAVLFPSWVYLVWRARAPAWTWLAVPVGAVVIVGAYWGLPYLFPVPGFEGTEVAGQGVTQVVGIFSWPASWGAWLQGHLNRWGFLAPLAAGAVLTGWWLDRRDPARAGAESAGPSPMPIRLFLLLAAAGLAVPLWLLDLEGSRGGAFDWDAFSVAALPLLALAGAFWSERWADRRVRWGWSPGVGLAVATTAVWIAVNSQPPTSVARFEDLLTSPHWSDRTRAMGAESLGMYYRDLGRIDLAAPWYRQAYRADRGNLRLGKNAGALSGQAGQHAESIPTLEILVDHAPGRPDLWSMLALARANTGDLPGAAQAYRIAVENGERRPHVLNDYARAVLLGLESSPRTLAEAARALELSLEADPDQPPAAEMRAMIRDLRAGRRPANMPTPAGENPPRLGGENDRP